MLAILPFQNLSNDPKQEYFSDGLTEETITDLGQLSPENLGVIARTTAMADKHTNKTVSQIGRESASTTSWKEACDAMAEKPASAPS